jgi:hypothetical protein
MKRTHNEIIDLDEIHPFKKRKFTEDSDDTITITLSKKHLEKLDVTDYHITKKPYYLQSVSEDGEMFYHELNTEHRYFQKVINAFQNGRLDDDESPFYESVFFSFIISIGEECNNLEEDEKNRFVKFFDLEEFKEDDFKNLVLHHKNEEDDYLYSTCLKGRRKFLENGILILSSFS